jgi:hypothetical protein
LNESGIEVWDSLMAGKKPGDIVDGLIEATDGEPEIVKADIAELVSLLLEKGILKTRP